MAPPGSNPSMRVFLILGIVFVVIGLSTNRTFLWIGLAFLVAAVVGLLRGRRVPGSARRGDGEP